MSKTSPGTPATTAHRQLGGQRADGGSGDDTLAGGTGIGPDGADRFIGGRQRPTWSTYTARTDALVLSIDGVANDGAGGCPGGGGCEDDDVETDVEDLIGGSARRHAHRQLGPELSSGGLGRRGHAERLGR